MMVYRSLAVPGEGPVGPPPPPTPPYFRTKLKFFFKTASPTPPPLSHGLDAPHPSRLLSEGLDLLLQIFKKKQK